MELTFLKGDWKDGFHDSGGYYSDNKLNSSFAAQTQETWWRQDPPSDEGYCFPYFSEDQGWQVEPGMETKQTEEVDSLDDPMLNYISELMEVEVAEDRTCMFIDCSSYQAMAKELTDLITDSSSPGDSSPSEHYSHDDSGSNESPSLAGADSWMDDGLRLAQPPVAFGTQIGENDLNSPASVNSIHDPAIAKQVIRSTPTPANGGSRKCVSPRPVEVEDEDAWDSDEEILRFIKEKAEALESNRSQPSKVDKCDGLVDECTEKLLTLFPCTGPGWRKNQGEKKQGIETLSCSAAANSLWDEPCMALMRRKSGPKLEETPQELEKRLSQEAENRVVLCSMLMDCAKAVAKDDMAKAYKLLNEVRQKVSAYGDSAQRLGNQFAEALAARITGTGGLLYSAMANNRPSAGEMLKAYYILACHHPFLKMRNIFCNRTILDACEGSQRLHIVDFGILYGFQWPCLIKELSSRIGGPPCLRITGIDFPQPGYKPAERIEETGQRLARLAKAWGVPFEYQAIATNWENVHPSALLLREDEVLVVNCAFRLRHLLDETVKAECPRKVVLKRIRSMNPKVFLQAVVNGGYNSPFFLSRFSEALTYFGSLFDALDSTISRDHPERLLVEQQMLGREILNVVACEGVERVERAEPYKQWQSRTVKAGFEQIPVNLEIYEKCRAILSSHHKDHGVGQDGNWLLIGWKGNVLKALSAWRPCV